MAYLGKERGELFLIEYRWFDVSSSLPASYLFRDVAAASGPVSVELHWRFMELTRAEVDRMLRHADEVRTKLRRATRELKRFGEEVMAAREAGRTAGSSGASASAEYPSDVDRSR